MVRCKECGFLALSNIKTGELDIAPARVRENGEIITKNSIHSYFLSCAVKAHDLMTGDRDELRRDKINEERECAKFFEWHPTRSPKEHEDMAILAQVKSEQHQWRVEDIQRHAAERAEDHRRQIDEWAKMHRWQQQQEALAEARHQEQRRDGRRIAINVALIGGACTLVAAIMSAILTGLFMLWTSPPMR